MNKSAPQHAPGRWIWRPPTHSLACCTACHTTQMHSGRRPQHCRIPPRRSRRLLHSGPACSSLAQHWWHCNITQGMSRYDRGGEWGVYAGSGCDRAGTVCTPTYAGSQQFILRHTTDNESLNCTNPSAPDTARTLHLQRKGDGCRGCDVTGGTATVEQRGQGGWDGALHSDGAHLRRPEHDHGAL